MLSTFRLVIILNQPRASLHQHPEQGGEAGGEGGDHDQLGEESGPGPVPHQRRPAPGGPDRASWTQEGDDQDGGENEQSSGEGDSVASVYQVLGEFDATKRNIPVSRGTRHL